MMSKRKLLRKIFFVFVVSSLLSFFDTPVANADPGDECYPPTNYPEGESCSACPNTDEFCWACDPEINAFCAGLPEGWGYCTPADDGDCCESTDRWTSSVACEPCCVNFLGGTCKPIGGVSWACGPPADVWACSPALNSPPSECYTGGSQGGCNVGEYCLSYYGAPEGDGSCTSCPEDAGEFCDAEHEDLCGTAGGCFQGETWRCRALEAGGVPYDWDCFEDEGWCSTDAEGECSQVGVCGSSVGCPDGVMCVDDGSGSTVCQGECDCSDPGTVGQCGTAGGCDTDVELCDADNDWGVPACHESTECGGNECTPALSTEDAEGYCADPTYYSPDCGDYSVCVASQADGLNHCIPCSEYTTCSPAVPFDEAVEKCNQAIYYGQGCGWGEVCMTDGLDVNNTVCVPCEDLLLESCENPQDVYYYTLCGASPVCGAGQWCKNEYTGGQYEAVCEPCPDDTNCTGGGESYTPSLCGASPQCGAGMWCHSEFLGGQFGGEIGTCEVCLSDEIDDTKSPNPFSVDAFINAFAIANNPDESIPRFISILYRIVLPVAVVIGMILIILAGYALMTSQGEPMKVMGAKEQLTSAIIGLLFVILGAYLLRLLITTLIN